MVGLASNMGSGDASRGRLDDGLKLGPWRRGERRSAWRQEVIGGYFFFAASSAGKGRRAAWRGMHRQLCGGRQVCHGMPERQTLERARRDAAEGKSTSTQAGEFVREQIHHIREGRHGARSTKQAIAIGLSEARRAGVPLPPPKGRGAVTRKARQDLAAGKRPHRASAKRSRAVTNALKRESTSVASHTALARQAKQAARKRSAADRSRAAKKAAATRRKRADGRAGRKTKRR